MNLESIGKIPFKDEWRNRWILIQEVQLEQKEDSSIYYSSVNHLKIRRKH
ncbi:hypothetical protein [Nostoc sp. ChiSLP03a]|nr:hypothetical protein [Nostoc sp. ChiSLP03a]MDZ8215722.1 hypothetical protein [Nostoc sp. ChiSLP03a]